VFGGAHNGKHSFVARTRRSRLDDPGITRRRCGRGFLYRGPDGSKVCEPETLDRIRKLAIPPAWTDVWICPWPNGHIQATGTDSAGRKQYLYHEDWRRQRDEEKYGRIREFGLVLPDLRERVSMDLDRSGLVQERVAAAAVRLLDTGFFRVGSEQYAEDNETYGVATLLKSHVRRRGDNLVFDYEAKGSKHRVAVVQDRQLLPLITSLKRRRTGGDSLLAWKSADGWVDLRSADVNAYIKQHAGDQFSAKDFRTWSATVMAAVGLAREHLDGSARPKEAVNRVMRQVADALGDTPAVSRASYVDPHVVESFQNGSTVSSRLKSLMNESDVELQWPSELEDDTRCAVERSVIRLLQAS
jgi:DNA topoisomerase-1